MKNRTLAIDAAAPATPLNPKIAAITAITKNIAVHFNIASNSNGYGFESIQFRAAYLIN